jgi:lipopolysaccharide biosynthesis protein
VLIAQDYSPADDLAHIQALLPSFQDPRYIRILNKPLFLVYRSSALPDPLATTTLWRQQAQASGLEDLHLVKVESFPTDRQRRPELDGFDAALDFQPDWGSLPSPRQPGLIQSLAQAGLPGLRA